ncbi:MAG: hypothetical protein ABIQ96_09735 [Luteolibacter sp.]
MIPFLKADGIAASILLALALLLVFLEINFPFGGYDLLLIHFVAGFWFFLADNLPAISPDAGTWGPGLGAFLLATAVAHRFLSGLAAKTGRNWNFATTFCLALVVPVLFVIAFIIPGVLLQWEMLRQTPWLETNSPYLLR